MEGEERNTRRTKEGRRRQGVEEIGGGGGARGWVKRSGRHIRHRHAREAGTYMREPEGQR